MQHIRHCFSLEPRRATPYSHGWRGSSLLSRLQTRPHVTRGGIVINELSRPAYGEATTVMRGGIVVNSVPSAPAERSTVVPYSLPAGVQDAQYRVVPLLIGALAAGTFLTIYERRKYGMAIVPRRESPGEL